MPDNDLVLRIPHSLGAAEAQRRLASGLDAAKAEYGSFLKAAETKWTANRLDFRVSALAQSVQGNVDVQESYVELTAQLPLVIRLLAKKFIPVIQNTGQKLLK